MEGLKNCLDDHDFVTFVTDFDLIFCSETWQRKNDSFVLEGYECFDVPRKESLQTKYRGHGGICLFVRSCIHKGIEVLETNSSGFIWIKVCKTFFNLKEDIYIGFAYIPPKDSFYYKLYNTDYFDVLEEGIRRYSFSDNIVIMGDLNARCGVRPDVPKPSDIFVNYLNTIDIDDNNSNIDLPERVSMDTTCNSSGIKLLDICLSSDLRIANGRAGDDAGIGQVTFSSFSGQSVIDYALITQALFSEIECFKVHDFYTFSTHAPIQLTFKCKYAESNKQENYTCNKRIVWDECKTDVFKNRVQNSVENLTEIVDNIVFSNIEVNTGIETFGNTLYDIAIQVFGKSAPKKQKNRADNCKFQSPWYTHECEIARSELARANKCFRRSRTNDNRIIVVNKRRNYCRAKRKARAIYKSKQQDRLQGMANSDPKKFWNEVRKVRGSKNKQTNITCEEFGEHFQNLFSANDIYKNDLIEEELVSDTGFQNVEQLDCQITNNEVQMAIKRLKPNKSSGIDALIPELFISSSNILSPLMCRLFNYMYENAVYPDCWTKGVIVPVPKKGSIHDVNNYRGITLTSIFSKLFSLILERRLRDWAESNNIIEDNQYGFRKHKSTVDCIFILQTLIDRILVKEKRKLFCAFVDYRKAFDLVLQERDMV